MHEEAAVKATCITYGKLFGHDWNLITHISSRCMGKLLIYQYELHSRIKILATTYYDINTKVVVSRLKRQQFFLLFQIIKQTSDRKQFWHIILPHASFKLILSKMFYVTCLLLLVNQWWFKLLL